MPSEALRNIRTMRQVKTSLDLAKNQRVKTTNSLSKTEEEETYLQSLSDRQLEQILAKERKRSTAMEAAVDKSQRRLIKAREKLAATINKNRALTELRHELQRARWGGSDSVPSKKTPLDEGGNLHRMELEY
jgi:LPS O-antigen subunit length determinant protein (WzzB/FepE family)